MNPSSYILSITVGTEKLRRFSFWAPQTLEGVVSYFLSRFSEKESMAKKEGARGIPISPGPLKAAKKTALVFLDLSRVAWKSNANPYCVTDLIRSMDLLQ